MRVIVQRATRMNMQRICLCKQEIQRTSVLACVRFCLANRSRASVRLQLAIGTREQLCEQARCCFVRVAYAIRNAGSAVRVAGKFQPVV